MTILGYDKSLDILPFDHRGYFETEIFGCTLSAGPRSARGSGSINTWTLQSVSYRLPGLGLLV